MNSLLIGIINLVVEFFSILILIEVIASWVAVANVRLPDTIVGLLQVISSITGIILNPIRRLIPSLGGWTSRPSLHSCCSVWCGRCWWDCCGEAASGETASSPVAARSYWRVIRGR